MNSDRSNIYMPSDEEDAEIIAAALTDPDALPLTDEQLEKMVPMRIWRALRAARADGGEVKRPLSDELIAYFQSKGEGWQAKLETALRECAPGP